MAKNKPLPEGLLARLHGKGSMSEVLKIERERLLQQSQQEMQRRLSGPAASPTPSLESEGHPTPVAPALERQPAPTAALAMAEPSLHPLPAGQVAQFAGRLTTARVEETGRLEGLSQFSRFAGEDLSDFGTIVRHSATSVKLSIEPQPTAVELYYGEKVNPSLPFTAQRNLLAAVRRLTLSRGALTCQIPLDVLAGACGIRNLKTLRKWLGDLHDKKHLKYTPLHGDLRGSLITLTPPPEILAVVQQWWGETPATLAKPSPLPDAGKFAGGGK